MLLKLGLVEAATSLIAGIFKSTLVGYAAGGAVQAVSMAYLTHVSGESLRRVLPPRPDLGRRRHAGRPDPPVRPHQPAEFLQEFAKQAVQKVSSRIPSRRIRNPGTAGVQELNDRSRTRTMSKLLGDHPATVSRADRRSPASAALLRKGE